MFFDNVSTIFLSLIPNLLVNDPHGRDGGAS